MAVWKSSIPEGLARDPVAMFIEGKWLVSRDGAVIAWFANEQDARRFAGD